MILITITITICALAFAAYVYFSHDKIAQRKAESYLAKWKVKEERKIREDAYVRSRAVSFGKTIEHYVPFMEDFPVKPGDVQFFGKPIDYIAFSDRGSKSKCSVHFIEVKSGKSGLNNHQKNIKAAIQEGRIHWHEFTVDGIFAHESRNQHLNS
jgi:predicted Holliday junction resolvase-like endonuclease|tara:strand:- start:319 stop:780 length:462 start_codon:yes stop_codon:yes gene_type:complete